VPMNSDAKWRHESRIDLSRLSDVGRGAGDP